MVASRRLFGFSPAIERFSRTPSILRCVDLLTASPTEIAASSLRRGTAEAVSQHVAVDDNRDDNPQRS
jgi:hypothetical protein